MGCRHVADARRQLDLAGARVQWHRERTEQGRRYRREGDEGRPEEGDTLAWMEAYVREMVKKHREEREIMISVLQVRGRRFHSTTFYCHCDYISLLLNTQLAVLYGAGRVSRIRVLTSWWKRHAACRMTRSALA